MQNPRRNANINKLNEVANINFNDFFSQFSITPYNNIPQHKKIGSARIRIIPEIPEEPQIRDNPETEAHDFHQNQNSHLTTMYQNNLGPMLTINGPVTENGITHTGGNPTSTYSTTQPQFQGREITLAG
jgi:hypothetical protein